ncbi:MAG: sulfur carrier protein ThiS adenylyltransferase ThiF [Bacteroidia bacterium]|nr:sulfur carrier protein ThiS adenylyltransferase ThiF [Bacteroidia bacterium]
MTFDQIKSALSTKTVGIAGCGGLGSNCAVALARVGVGKLIIADFDLVSESNLNRQYFFHNQIGQKKIIALKENIRRINPDFEVEVVEDKLTPRTIPSVFDSCDVVVEAFDLADQKEMLIETMLKAFPQKPLVIGLGMAGWGKNDLIHFRKSDNLYICGDEVSEISDELPPLAPRVGMVANMQANVVLDILLNMEHR